MVGAPHVGEQVSVSKLPNEKVLSVQDNKKLIVT